MDYPADFARKVLDEYDNDSELVRLLEEGSPVLGQYLDSFSHRNIGPEEILDALDSGDTDGLRSKAADLVCRKELYAEWFHLHDAQDG